MMSEVMMCVCGHPVASHINALKCCISCGCDKCIPTLKWNVEYTITFDEDTDDSDGWTK